jgi:para-nitrobenzyl esterase
MKNLIRKRVIFLTLLSVFLASCSRDSDTQQTAVPGTAPATAEVGVQAQAEEYTTEEAGGLGGTSWRLVQIMSMDDNTYKPDDPSLYTLTFGADGTMNVLADCNRGTGSWISESDGQLQFGPIAATMALCPPESLHDRYLSQFEWVRSYVIRDGHLFLATMADGSIIEFEPADDD